MASDHTKELSKLSKFKLEFYSWAGD